METLEHLPEDGPAMPAANDVDVSANSSPDPLGSTGPSESLASSSSSSLPDEEFAESAPFAFDKPKVARISVQIPSSTLVNPKSAFDGYEPPLPPTREHVAVEALMAATRSKPSSQKFVEFELSEFTFYADPRNYPKEMRSLHQFSTKNGHDKFYFDGGSVPVRPATTLLKSRSASCPSATTVRSTHRWTTKSGFGQSGIKRGTRSFITGSPNRPSSTGASAIPFCGWQTWPNTLPTSPPLSARIARSIWGSSGKISSNGSSRPTANQP